VFTALKLGNLGKRVILREKIIKSELKRRDKKHALVLDSCYCLISSAAPVTFYTYHIDISIDLLIKNKKKNDLISFHSSLITSD
jgi:hypothetical protein